MSLEFPGVSVDCPLSLVDLSSLSESLISLDLAEWRNYRWKGMQPVKLQKFLSIDRLTINHMGLFRFKLMIKY